MLDPNGPGERYELNHTAKFRRTPHQPELFSLYEEEPGGGPQTQVQRHAVEQLVDVPGSTSPPGGFPATLSGCAAGATCGLERHFLEHMADICPFVQILDAPVPQPVVNSST